jgi:hypothetical protein
VTTKGDYKLNLNHRDNIIIYLNNNSLSNLIVIGGLFIHEQLLIAGETSWCSSAKVNAAEKSLRISSSRDRIRNAAL